MKQETKVETKVDFIELISREGVDAIYKELFGDRKPKKLTRKEAMTLGKAIHEAAVNKLFETGMSASEIAEAIGFTEAHVRNLLAK